MTFSLSVLGAVVVGGVACGVLLEEVSDRILCECCGHESANLG
jgi:hypothetical protein